MTEASARRKKSHDLRAGYMHVRAHFFVMDNGTKMYLITFSSERRNTKMYNHIHCSERSLRGVHAATESNKSSG